jgi:hypothetical protein
VRQQRRQPLLHPAPFDLAVIEPAAQIPNRLHVPIAGALLSTTERAALVTRLDQKPARADWAAYEAQLEAMLRLPR